MENLLIHFQAAGINWLWQIQSAHGIPVWTIFLNPLIRFYKKKPHRPVPIFGPLDNHMYGINFLYFFLAITSELRYNYKRVQAYRHIAQPLAGSHDTLYLHSIQRRGFPQPVRGQKARGTIQGHIRIGRLKLTPGMPFLLVLFYMRNLSFQAKISI